MRDNAIAAVVQAAYAAATALNAVVLWGEPEELHFSGPPTRPLAHLTDVTAEIAALDAFTAAVDASAAVGYSDNFIKGAVGDYQRLLSLNLGIYPWLDSRSTLRPMARSAHSEPNSPCGTVENSGDRDLLFSPSNDVNGSTTY